MSWASRLLREGGGLREARPREPRAAGESSTTRESEEAPGVVSRGGGEARRSENEDLWKSQLPIERVFERQPEPSLENYSLPSTHYNFMA